MNVHLRQKRRPKSDKITLMLEIYEGYTLRETGTIKPTRRMKKLDYFLYASPKTPSEKLHNKESLRKAEIIKGMVLKELMDGKNGFKTNTKAKANFIEYFRKLTKDRFASRGNYGNWDSVLKHLIKYKGEIVPFQSVDVVFCEGFKEYLTKTARTSTGKPLSSSSVSSYFCKLRAALNFAVDEEILLNNPSSKVSTPKVIESEREFLTLEEVKLIYKAECRYEVLKRAFLFSCLTGLRWSDINQLKWSQVLKEGEQWKIVFHQQKTKGLQYHYISDQARELLGKQQDNNHKVFVGLRYSDHMNTALLQWMLRAGITKHITFHCGRHTFATLQLTLGTDLYTVSKLLGHSDIKTTQIYAKIIDDKKIEAVNKIPTIID